MTLLFQFQKMMSYLFEIKGAGINNADINTIIGRKI